MKLAITLIALSAQLAFAADKPLPPVPVKAADRPWCIIPPLILPVVKPPPRTVLPPPPSPFILEPLDADDAEG